MSTHVPSIKINNAEKTCLKKKYLVELINNFFKFDEKVVITFSYRLKNFFGTYCFDNEKKQHTIEISILRNSHELEGFDYKNKRIHLRNSDYEESLSNYIETLMHELFHAKQHELLGEKDFGSNEYYTCKYFKTDMIAEHYSLIETTARIFEHEKSLDAILYYKEVEAEDEGKG